MVAKASAHDKTSRDPSEIVLSLPCLYRFDGLCVSRARLRNVCSLVVLVTCRRWQATKMDISTWSHAGFGGHRFLLEAVDRLLLSMFSENDRTLECFQSACMNLTQHPSGAVMAAQLHLSPTFLPFMWNPEVWMRNEICLICRTTDDRWTMALSEARTDGS